MKKLGKKLHNCDNTIEAYSSVGKCTCPYDNCGNNTENMVNQMWYTYGK